MKSICLVPYCPTPADTGAKVEMWKHLHILKDLGLCTIASARERPVGMGWSDEIETDIRSQGYAMAFRQRQDSPKGLARLMSMTYGSVFFGLGISKAFGSGNPYHRLAFAADWWLEQTDGMDLSVVSYSHWADLPSHCPQVVVLHDLLSTHMWGSLSREVERLSKADKVLVISQNEVAVLKKQGLRNVQWCPPIVRASYREAPHRCAIIGSDSPFNREGLKWLCGSESTMEHPIRVYGNLASAIAQDPRFEPRGRYERHSQPYEESRVVAMTTAQGMGVQIKGIEALAHGAVLVARKGAMRGIPHSSTAWIEVETPKEMWDVLARVQSDEEECRSRSRAARAYYEEYLDAKPLAEKLSRTYREVAANLLGGENG